MVSCADPLDALSRFSYRRSLSTVLHVEQNFSHASFGLFQSAGIVCSISAIMVVKGYLRHHGIVMLHGASVHHAATLCLYANICLCSCKPPATGGSEMKSGRETVGYIAKLRTVEIMVLRQKKEASKLDRLLITNKQSQCSLYILMLTIFELNHASMAAVRKCIGSYKKMNLCSVEGMQPRRRRYDR